MNWVSRSRFISYFYVCFLLLLAVRWWDGLTLLQLGAQPIHSPRQDPIIWIWQWINAPDFFCGPIVSKLLTGLVGMLPILILYLEKEKKNNRPIILIHTIAVAIFLVTIYSFPTLSIRKYLPMVIVPVAFLFVTEERYQFTLRAIRYWVCYIFASAAIWKIVRGAAFDKEHMIETIRSQHIDTIVHYSDHYMSGIASWLIAHPMACVALLIAAVLSQLTFLIGFFTRNYDRWLMALLVIFVLADYLVMRIEYWEYALLLPLLYIPTIKQKQ